MGLYTSLSGAGTEDIGNRDAFDLALQTGSSPEEARELAKNPDAMLFLKQKWRRQQVETGVPQAGPPPDRIPSREPGSLMEALKNLPANLMPRSLQYALGQTSETGPAVPQAPPTSALADYPEGPAQTPAAEPQALPQFPESLPPPSPVNYSSGPSDLIGQGPRTPTFDPTEAPMLAAANATAAQEGNDKRRMWQRIAAGLSRGGATASSGRTVMDFLQGTAPRAPDMRAHDALDARADETEARDLAKVEETKAAVTEAQSPLLKAYNREYDTEFSTVNEMREHRATQATEASTAQGERKLDLQEQEMLSKQSNAKLAEQMAADQERRFAQGDMSAAPEKLKAVILSEANTWTKNNEKVAAARGAADRLEALLDAENSVGARMAITQMVLLSGETGRLTEGDIGRMARRMGFEGYKDFVKNFVISDLNPEQRAEFLEIADRVRQDATRKLRKSAKIHTSRLSKLYPNLKQSSLMEMLLGDNAKGEAKKVWVLPTGATKKQQVDAEDVDQGVSEGLWEKL